MTITTFDRKNLGALQSEILAAIAGLCEKHGVTAAQAGGTIDATEAVLKFKFAVIDADPSQNVHGKSYAVFAPKDLPALGSIVKDGANAYRIVGWNSGAPKRPVMLREVGTNKDVRAPAEWVRRRMAAGNFENPAAA